MVSTVYDIKDLQKILKIGRSQAYALVESGKIKAFRTGKCWKITEAALNEYIAKSEKNGVE